MISKNWQIFDHLYIPVHKTEYLGDIISLFGYGYSTVGKNMSELELKDLNRSQ